MGYGPNGEYATVRDYLNANSSARLAYEEAARKGAEEAKEKAEKIRAAYESSRRDNSALEANGKKISAFSTMNSSKLLKNVNNGSTVTSNLRNTLANRAATVDINITYATVEENISKLNTAINTLKNTWNGETKSNLNIIENSWAGDDCSAYTQKLKNMDNKVQNTISALELLRSTYQNAVDQVKQSQSSSLSSINNLEG